MTSAMNNVNPKVHATKEIMLVDDREDNLLSMETTVLEPDGYRFVESLIGQTGP